MGCYSSIFQYGSSSKDSDNLNSFRPISLLNSDYKIITKLLANRLNPIAHQLINSYQNGFIADRQLSTNTHFLIDALEFFNSKQIPTHIFFLDAEKAFDLVNWESIFYI